jgi:mannose-6-phosphate isomerase-like protein (cupin superfamily)
MRAFNKSTTPTKLSENGMSIYELVGRTLEPSTNRHSVAEVLIPPGKSSRRHYHPQAEKTYYVIQGTGLLQIDDASSTISSGDAILIPAQRANKVFNRGDEDLLLIVICVPAWEPSDTVWLESA